MQLVLDMSQNIINRTAVFWIANDIDAILAEYNPVYQYFGNIFQQKIDTKLAQKLKTMFFNSFGDHAADITSCLLPRNDNDILLKKANVRRFYVDPLYVCYADLKPDDIVLTHDISPIIYPQWHGVEVCRAYQCAFEKILDVKPHLLADSHHTAESMYANFGYSIGEIKVIHLYLPRHISEGAQNVEPLYAVKPYFLFTGSLESRKNLIGAVEAFRLSRLHEAGYQLFLVGGKGRGNEAILKRVDEVPGVSWCGYLSNEELISYYGGASGFLYPSYLEGFGVPLLEALHFGVPAVVTTTGASPEVGGDLVAYADPDDHAAIARRMQDIADMSAEDRADFAIRAKQRVREFFSFEKFAASIQQQLREAQMTDNFHQILRLSLADELCRQWSTLSVERKAGLPKFVHNLMDDGIFCPDGSSDSYILLAARVRKNLLDSHYRIEDEDCPEDRMARTILLAIDRLLIEAVTLERWLFKHVKDQA